MITCRECGTQNPAESQLCAQCGAVLPPEGLPAGETEARAGAEEQLVAGPEDESESPDWLAGIVGEGDDLRDAGVAGEDIEPESEAGMPAWLAALEEEDAAAELAFDREELPAWLADIGAGDSQILPVDEENLAELDDLAAILEPESDLPAAEVEDFAAQLPDLAGDQDVGLPAPAGDEEAPPVVDEQAEEKPDATAPLARPEPVPKTITGELTNVPPQLVGTDLPEWLRDNPLDVDVPEGELAPEEVPDWLQPGAEKEYDDLLTLDEAEAAALASSGEWAALLEELPVAEATTPTDHDPSAADIPEWLEALRPTDTTAAVEEDSAGAAEPVPQTGPLAGFAGAIHIEPIVALPRAAERPPAAFAISPEQRRQVLLLRSLMTTEYEPPDLALPLRRRDLPPTVRIVLAFLLLAVVIIGLFGPQVIEITQPISPAALPVQEIIATTANRPVLVAFEYTPAMAGELTPQALTLLTSLAAQNSPVMVVSQSATGLTIGAQTVQEVNDLPVTSLTLIPGDAVGLRQLGGCVADPAGCDTLYGQPLNATQRATLADLGLILVFAAERDGLVSWMEQVSPQIDVPVVAGVTQALAPVARPYFYSEQLQGVMEGFPDAAAYEQAVGQDGPNSNRVWAVGLAQWIAAAALIVGNVFWLMQFDRKGNTNG